eukprot:4628676-Amphidinium_carterae.1
MFIPNCLPVSFTDGREFVRLEYDEEAAPHAHREACNSTLKFLPQWQFWVVACCRNSSPIYVHPDSDLIF